MPDALPERRHASLLLGTAIFVGAVGVMTLVLAFLREVPTLERASRIAQAAMFLMMAGIFVRQRHLLAVRDPSRGEETARSVDRVVLALSVGVMVLGAFTLWTLTR